MHSPYHATPETKRAERNPNMRWVPPALHVPCHEAIGPFRPSLATSVRFVSVRGPTYPNIVHIKPAVSATRLARPVQGKKRTERGCAWRKVGLHTSPVPGNPAAWYVTGAGKDARPNRKEATVTKAELIAALAHLPDDAEILVEAYAMGDEFVLPVLRVTAYADSAYLVAEAPEDEEG